MRRGYSGGMNLLCRYITRGRAGADRPHLSPKRVTRLRPTRPEALGDGQRSLLAGLTAARAEMARARRRCRLCTRPGKGRFHRNRGMTAARQRYGIGLTGIIGKLIASPERFL